MTISETECGVVVRRRVSLAGRVTVPGGAIAIGGVVVLTPALGTKRRAVEPSSQHAGRRYETHIRGDGFYVFCDLPDGSYVLSGQDADGQAIEVQSVAISESDHASAPYFKAFDLIATAPQARVEGERL
jgi:hypothetical protein